LYWRRRLTRLELALYAAVVGIALLAFFERALHYMEIAERTAVEVTIANVNSALALRSARGLLAGRAAESASNPFALTGAPPNYLGAVSGAELDTFARRVWLFDEERNEVVYLPRHMRTLHSDEPAKVVRFKQVWRGGVQKLVPTDTWRWSER